MYTKIVKKPKEICISAIYSALSQIFGIHNLIWETDDEIRFNWIKGYHFRGEYQRGRLGSSYTGKIKFEGDETTKITIILKLFALNIYILIISSLFILTLLILFFFKI